MSRAGRHRGWGERWLAQDGSASVLAAVWIAVLALLGAALLVMVAGMSVRTQVESAADLGALAGATAVLDGEQAVCERAADLIRANGARMRSCRIGGAQVWVEASAPMPAAVRRFWRGPAGELRARAHAELVGEDR